MTKEKNPLACDVCGHISGAPATARIHANTHITTTPGLEVDAGIEVEKVKKVVKKKK